MNLSDIKLSWSRDEDGVVVVYARDTHGRISQVADFWVSPLVAHLKMTREDAKDLQTKLADAFVSAVNNKGE